MPTGPFSDIRVVMYGVGAMGALATCILVDKGAEIVGAEGCSCSKVGRDLGGTTEARTALPMPSDV